MVVALLRDAAETARAESRVTVDKKEVEAAAPFLACLGDEVPYVCWVPHGFVII